MLRPISPYIEYELNKDYIKDFLCIQRAQPKNSCAGKCHIIKRLQETQEHQDVPALAVNLIEYPIGFVNFYTFGALQRPESGIKHFADCTELYTRLAPSDIFHPPIFS